jgi:hypothetical protein
MKNRLEMVCNRIMEKNYRLSQAQIRAGILLITFVIGQFSFLPVSMSAIVTPSVPEGVGLPALDSSALGKSGFLYVDGEHGAFAIFSDRTKADVPLYLGKVECREGREQFTATRKIVPMEEMYVITSPADPAFLEVVERFPGGGFGRLLRHRSDKVNLEFVYGDREGEVTILDHGAGLFYQITFTEKETEPVSVKARTRSEVQRPRLVAVGSQSPKVGMPASGFDSIPALLFSRLVSSNEGVSQKDVWMKRKVRGPPGEDLTL